METKATDTTKAWQTPSFVLLLWISIKLKLKEWINFIPKRSLFLSYHLKQKCMVSQLTYKPYIAAEVNFQLMFKSIKVNISFCRRHFVKFRNDFT